MKVVFLQKDSFVKLAFTHLYAVLNKHGYESELFIESGEKDFINSALESGADLFAFSCTTGGEHWIARTAERLKKKSATPIIVGGPHPTFFPHIIQDPHIDYICRGEGEEALIELLETLRHNPQKDKIIHNIWSKDPSGKINKTDLRPFIQNLDDLPQPDFEIYSKYGYLTSYNREMYAVMTGRGCPHNCSYCFNKSYKEIYKKKGKYLRKRSPAHVTQELANVKENYGIRKINFVDDGFFIHSNWVKEFAKLYKKEINLPFIINVEATRVNDELVRIIKDMGCICIRMGVETGNEHLRQTVLKKKVTNRQIKEAASHIKRYGIKLSTYNMLGLPGESLNNALETYLLNKEIRSDFIWCSLLQPYPGTEIFSYVEENGFFADDHNTVLEESYFVASNIKMENKNEIVNLQKLMQFSIQLHIPLRIVNLIIKFPANPLYHLIFKLNFIFNKIRTQQIRLVPLIMLGLHSLSYMSREKSKT
jgi:radical SAM superfamily enzyme YgiQ (UPF0313 family)